MLSSFSDNMSTMGFNDHMYESYHVLASQKSAYHYQTEIPQNCNTQSSIELLDDGYCLSDVYEFNPTAELSFHPFCGAIRYTYYIIYINIVS